ncbi:hypothetical protein HMI55_002179 [Coelomomyces lativittatus]|nr:hypothetical protein HMI55_002179 [Coelomomyces lativittatus]
MSEETSFHDSIATYAKDLARLALFTQSNKHCLRRTDIHQLVFKNERISNAVYTNVLNAANLILSETFGFILQPGPTSTSGSSFLQNPSA